MQSSRNKLLGFAASPFRRLNNGWLQPVERPALVTPPYRPPYPPRSHAQLCADMHKLMQAT
jgi:hypothetical protein